jgi:hypothetical protein
MSRQRRAAGERVSKRMRLRIVRGRLARRCQHNAGKLVPAGGDQLVLICCSCGDVLETLERTETLDT